MTYSCPKLFVGPMSKTVVDACIEYSNLNKVPLGIIPSRRQVDMTSGYVNGWRTDTLSSYVRDRSNVILLERDHGGPMQGDVEDDGVSSMVVDSSHLDMIHIDPFKNHKTIESAALYTSNIINYLSNTSPCDFEIGTEEAIFPMTIEDAKLFFSSVKKMTRENFNRVRYLVVQFGTKIIGNHNTGQFDVDRARDMIALCKSFGKMSKEHNGDYLTKEAVKVRRDLGLDALNVAPEMGGIESECLLEEMEGRQELLDLFFELCLSTNRWQKWFAKDFDPYQDKKKVILACGHYCFSDPRFELVAKKINYAKVIEESKRRMLTRLGELS